MNKKQFLTASFITWVVCTFIGAALKIMHHPNADLLLTISIVGYVVFAAAAVHEIITSCNIDKTEKIMWTIGMLFFGAITGIIYLVGGRRRIITAETKLKF